MGLIFFYIDSVFFFFLLEGLIKCGMIDNFRKVDYMGRKLILINDIIRCKLSYIFIVVLLLFVYLYD